MTRSRYHGIASNASIMPAAARRSRAVSNNGTTRRGGVTPASRCRSSTARTSDGFPAIVITYAPSDSGWTAAIMRNVSRTSATRAFVGIRGGVSLRPCVEHVDEEIHSTIFRPAPVLAEPQRARDGIDGLGVPLGFLADVEPHQRHAEGRQAPEDVGQTAVGDDAVAGGVERAVAEQERLDELRHRLEHLRLPREAGVDGGTVG